MRDGGGRLGHVCGPGQTPSRLWKRAARLVAGATHRSTLLFSTLASGRCGLGRTKPPTACLPSGHRTSSSKASFLGVPCHLTGLLTYPRSPFPKSVSLPHSEINFLPQGYYLPGASGGGPTLNIHLEYSRAGFMQRWYPLPIGRTWLQTAVSLGSLKGALHTIRQFQFSLVPTTCL